MPWYLFLALRQLFPSGRICSFFALVSILGVTLGVMVLLIVQSVMNGFGEEITRKLIDANGHIRIESGQIMDDAHGVVDRMRQHPDVVAAEPYAQGVVMAVHRKRPAFPVVRGIELPPEGEDSGVMPLDQFMLMGEVDDLFDDGVILSAGLASSLGASVGSVIEVYSPLMLERLRADEVLLPRELEVVGIFEIGWSQIDSNTMLGTLRLMQDLYGLGDGVHGVTLRLASDNRVDRVAAELNNQLESPLHAYTWLASNRDLLFVLRLEKTVMFFIILFIILVASFSIASSLLTTVVRKTREIGLIGALGGKAWHIAAVFCLQGFLIGLTGVILGFSGALLALAYRNEIVQGFARWTQSEAALLHYYQFSDIPVHYERADFIVITVFALLIATLAGLIPALRAARLNSAEALRNEF